MVDVTVQSTATADVARRTGPSTVFALCMVTGSLLAFSVGTGVRLYRGHTPGVVPPPYANLLGKKAPGIEVPGLDGGTVSLPSGSGRHVIYFSDSGCKACDRAYPQLRDWVQQVGDVPVVVVATGQGDSVRAKLARHGIATTVAFDSGRQAVAAYGIHAFPSALLVGDDGRVLAGAFGSGALGHIRQALAAD